MQFIADIIGAPVDRPKVLETTAMGVAWLAGMKVDFYSSQNEFASNWVKEKRFEVKMSPMERELLYKGWKESVQRTLVKY